MRRHAVWAAAAIAMPISLGAPAADAETIAVVTKSQSNPVARSVRAGAAAAAKTLGFKVLHYIPTTADNPEQQSALIEEAIRSKSAAAVISPIDPKGQVAVVQKVMAAGIPAVNVVDRLAGGSAPFVGTDDRALALAIGRVLLKAMGGKGNVVMLEGAANVPSSTARVRGFNEALKEFPGVKLLASKSASYSRTLANDVMKGFIRQFPQIDGVLAANDPMAIGAIEALKAANRKPLVVGINASREGVALIKLGDLLATGEYHGFAEGCLGVEIAVRALRKQAAPKEVVLQAAVVEKANVAAFETPPERRPCPTLDSLAAKAAK